MTPDARDKLIVLAVFLLPLALVKGAPLVLVEHGPKAAQAAPPPPVMPPAALATNEESWTDEQKAAAMYIVSLRNKPFGETPLFHPERDDTNPPPPPVHVEVRQEPPPDVSVQMIMTARGGNVALINRHRYRVGDPIGDGGWIVTRIDSITRSVEIAHPETERTHELRVPLPR